MFSASATHLHSTSQTIYALLQVLWTSIGGFLTSFYHKDSISRIVFRKKSRRWDVVHQIQAIQKKQQHTDKSIKQWRVKRAQRRRNSESYYSALGTQVRQRGCTLCETEHHPMVGNSSSRFGDSFPLRFLCQAAYRGRTFGGDVRRAFLCVLYVIVFFAFGHLFDRQNVIWASFVFSILCLSWKREI